MRKQTKLIVALSATALLALGLSAVSFAAGWDNSTGEWQYIDSDGNAVADEWKKSGDYWFYLSGDGNMARNQIVEYDEDYYYVDEQGAMVTNTWKVVEKDDADGTDAEYYWYYFGSDGKAYTNGSSKITASKIKTINGLKYTFDSEGHMLYGWLLEDSVQLQDSDDSAWKDAKYYFGGWNDGHMATGWQQLTVENAGDDADESKIYWFYFGTDGKKADNEIKKVNDVKYNFAVDGHMIDEWAAGTSTDLSTTNVLATPGSINYLNGDGGQRKSTWVYAIPDEDYDKANYDDDEYKWWYFNSNGNLYSNVVRTINGKKYAFDVKGEMINKFVVSVSGSVTNIKSNGDKLADLTREEYSKLSPIEDLYYFSSDYEKDGSLQKGYTNVGLDDGTYQFYFNKTSGKAATEYNGTIHKFLNNGLVMKTTSDDDSNYAAVNASSTSGYTGGKLLFGQETVGKILVNASGSIMKKKTNLKDSNGAYYCTNDDGVVTYFNTDYKASKTQNSDVKNPYASVTNNGVTWYITNND